MTTTSFSGRRRLLTIYEAAEFMTVSTKTIRRWIEAGELRAHKLGRQWRIAPDDMEHFLVSRATGQRG